MLFAAEHGVASSSRVAVAAGIGTVFGCANALYVTPAATVHFNTFVIMSCNDEARSSSSAWSRNGD